MKTKHTPGEWLSKEGQIYPQETGKTLALIPYFNEENEEQQANQKLIAASPDLLQCLLQFIHSVEHEGVVSGRVAGAVEYANEIIQKATN